MSDTWYKRLRPTIESDEFKKLANFIAEEKKTKTIYPSREHIFKAFNTTPFEDVKVVLLGMDPYPTEYKGEPVACGLAFAPNNPDFKPPSLRIIYKNLQDTVYKDDLSFPEDLDMRTWADQGVLLLNTGLTVVKGKAGSHIKQWAFFTKAVIETLNESSGIIFLLWGKEAQKYKSLINEDKHYILESSHPAASIYSGQPWECNHFQKVNYYLKLNHNEEIKWLQNLN